MNIAPLGDRGLLIGPFGRAGRRTTTKIAAAAETVRHLDGVIDAIPGTRFLLVEVEASKRTTIMRRINSISLQAAKFKGRLYELATAYDGEDLEWAANHLGLTQQTLVDIHSSRVYDVRMIGSPGFIYLSDVPKRIRLPRLSEPRKWVEKGTVGIGGKQTGIYGLPRPGGWRLIAHVSEVPEVQVGDRIRFVPTK